MDGAEPDPTSWVAPRAAVVLGAVVALGLGGWAVTAADAPGRVLGGLAALAVGAVTLVGALARPRLTAGIGGLTVRGLAGARTWPWPRVDAVRVVRPRRLGLPMAYLEVDARDDDGRDRLLVLGRLELGADPADVAPVLQRHRARAGRGNGPVSAEREIPGADEDEQDDDHDPRDGEADRDP